LWVPYIPNITVSTRHFPEQIRLPSISENQFEYRALPNIRMSTLTS